MYSKSSPVASALLLAWLVLAAPALAQERSAMTQTGDAWITTKIQAAYFLDADVKARTINVTTKDGVVTLTGTVESERERDQAVSIARTTDGVKNVVDKLVMRSPGAAGTSGAAKPEREPAGQERTRMPGSDEVTKVAESDISILTQIKTKLAVDPEVSALAIDVDVKDGAVTLTGKVKNEAARQRALAIARGVQGVKAVQDRLSIQSP